MRRIIRAIVSHKKLTGALAVLAAIIVSSFVMESSAPNTSEPVAVATPAPPASASPAPSVPTMVSQVFTVRDGSGNSIAQAEVWVVKVGSTNSSPIEITDSSGKVIMTLPPGTYHVSAAKGGYDLYFQGEITIPTGSTHSVQLDPKGTAQERGRPATDVSGQVTPNADTVDKAIEACLVYGSLCATDRSQILSVTSATLPFNWRTAFRDGTNIGFRNGSDGGAPGWKISLTGNRAVFIEVLCGNLVIPPVVPTPTTPPGVSTPTPTPAATPTPVVVIPTPTPTPFRPPLAVTIAVGPFSHTAQTGVQTTTVTAAPTGGDGNYTYSWSSAGNTQILSGQGSSQILLQVTGCSAYSVTITVTSVGSTATQSTGSTTPGDCPATSLTLQWVQCASGNWPCANPADPWGPYTNGAYQTFVIGYATGGASPYTWGGSATGSGNIMAVPRTVTAGQTSTGTLTVTDNFGNAQTQPWTVTAPAPPPTPSAPTVNVTATNSTSSSSCTYTVVANVAPAGSYSFTWSGTISSGASVVQNYTAGGQTILVTLSFGQRANLTVTAQNTANSSVPAGTGNWQQVCGQSGY